MLETAKSASARGYGVTIISDAVASVFIQSAAVSLMSGAHPILRSAAEDLEQRGARQRPEAPLKDPGAQVESSEEFMTSLGGEKSRA